MRRWIIASLFAAVGQHALAADPVPVWDRSNTLLCRVVSPGAAFDTVRIDYGKSAVDLGARGAGRESWTISGISDRTGAAGREQLVHVRRGTRAGDLVLRRDGTLRIQFQRDDRTVVIEARCRAR
jgi:hypothetical protein